MCAVQKLKNPQTQEQVHSQIEKEKQQGDAREKFPSITHFFEKQWQFCNGLLCQVVTFHKFDCNVIYLLHNFKGATYSV